MNQLLMTFYGDDVTGSTDALETLASGGVRSVLFLEPPTEEMSAEFPDVEAIGVAGLSRSMAPTEMTATLTPAFESLRRLGAPICHYKVCSTFDSSPTIGSIGCAGEIGAEVFGASSVPIVVGAPALGRYVTFGNLFARGVDGVDRIDRHPTMSRHPITPMNEGDLRRHLGGQTAEPIDSIDLETMSRGVDAIADRLDRIVRRGARFVVFDTLTVEHLADIGRVLAATATAATNGSLFVIGSSGVEQALVAAWRHCGSVRRSSSIGSLDPVEQIVVMSGSASPATARQIDWAETQGFATIRIDPVTLIGTDARCEEDRLCRAAVTAWRDGHSVLLYSVRGPDDPSLVSAGADGSGSMTRRLATAQGRVLRRVIEQTGASRVCVAGGDTCGHVAAALGIHALTIRTSLDPAGPICRAYADDPLVDGLDIALKGGQVGTEAYFGKVRDGAADAATR